MPTVPLAPPPVGDTVPRRRALSHGALETLAETTATPLPWARPAAPTALTAALGPVPAPSTASRDGEEAALRAELVHAGLLTGDRVAPEAALALARFGRPEVAVRLSLTLRVPGPSAPAEPVPDQAAWAQLDSWHRLASGQVTAITTTAQRCELAWYAVDHWPRELALVARRALSVTGGAELPPGLTLPLPLVLAAGRAREERRPDLLAGLLDRYAGLVCDEAGPLSRERAASILADLHGGLTGRLALTVTGRAARGRPRTAGLVSWVLAADGWRELTPVARADAGAGEPMVALRPVPPWALGERGARLVMEVAR